MAPPLPSSSPPAASAGRVRPWNEAALHGHRKPPRWPRLRQGHGLAGHALRAGPSGGIRGRVRRCARAALALPRDRVVRASRAWGVLEDDPEVHAQPDRLLLLLPREPRGPGDHDPADLAPTGTASADVGS